MEMIVLKNRFFFIGRVKELRPFLEELSKAHYTINELIQSRLN